MYGRSLRINEALMPCILSFQISLSKYSEVGRVLAEPLPQGPLSRIPTPNYGAKSF